MSASLLVGKVSLPAAYKFQAERRHSEGEEQTEQGAGRWAAKSTTTDNREKANGNNERKRPRVYSEGQEDEVGNVSQVTNARRSLTHSSLASALRSYHLFVPLVIIEEGLKFDFRENVDLDSAVFEERKDRR